MDDKNGRAAIIENGSPLFTGGTASGESQVRRWLLEQDLIEAIIAMPTDLFYNTGIATYVWLLSKNKRPERKGKIQLIDATAMKSPLRRNMGKKNCEFTPEIRKEIPVNAAIKINNINERAEAYPKLYFEKASSYTI